MRAFFAPHTEDIENANTSFERWLEETCSTRDLSERERVRRLASWEAAPFARVCHPREEHLLPLHVCYGFAGSACTESFHLRILGKASSMYSWETRS